MGWTNFAPLGMIGLVFPLFAWFYAIAAGYDLTENVMKSIAATEIVGFICLTIMATGHVILSPFGPEVSMLFSAIPAGYAFIWLVAAFVHWYGLDAKVLGDMALGLTIGEILLTWALFAVGAAVSWGVIIVLLIYAPGVTVGFYLVNHDIGTPATTYYTGFMALLATIGTWHIMLIGSGLIEPILPMI